jgi:hypothetical protein
MASSRFEYACTTSGIGSAPQPRHFELMTAIVGACLEYLKLRTVNS